MPWSTSNRSQRLPADWSKRRRLVLRRDPTCQLRYDCCTIDSTEVDHRIHGDDHSITNLQGVCSPCHKRKTRAEAQAAKPSRQRKSERHPGLIAPGD